MFFRMVYKAG